VFFTSLAEHLLLRSQKNNKTYKKIKTKNKKKRVWNMFKTKRPVKSEEIRWWYFKWQASIESPTPWNKSSDHKGWTLSNKWPVQTTVAQGDPKWVEIAQQVMWRHMKFILAPRSRASYFSDQLKSALKEKDETCGGGSVCMCPRPRQQCICSHPNT